MIGAGTIINPILKIVTTVAILGAVYLFIVRPVLDTTEEISGRAFDATSQFGSDFDKAFESIPDTAKIQGQVQKALNRSGASNKDANKLLTCIQRAGGDVDKMTRCTD